MMGEDARVGQVSIGGNEENLKLLEFTDCF